MLAFATDYLVNVVVSVCQHRRNPYRETPVSVYLNNGKETVEVLNVVLHQKLEKQDSFLCDSLCLWMHQWSLPSHTAVETSVVHLWHLSLPLSPSLCVCAWDVLLTERWLLHATPPTACVQWSVWWTCPNSDPLPTERRRNTPITGQRQLSVWSGLRRFPQVLL